MEQSSPVPDSQMLKAEVESVTEGSLPVRQLQNSTSTVQNDHHVSHDGADKADADGDCHVGDLTASHTTLDDVRERSVSEGTIETLTSKEAKDLCATTLIRNERPSVLVTNCLTEPLSADDSGLAESTSSIQSTSNSCPMDSTTTSGISNGPSTPSSDTVSSSLASSPQSSAIISVPSHSLQSPYDTDCSRKLISQIQRSLSQESLLDELESELLACQLPDGESGGERKGSLPLNGLPTDQEGCMVAFEKCVQYKYAQQEKAIQR